MASGEQQTIDNYLPYLKYGDSTKEPIPPVSTSNGKINYTEIEDVVTNFKDMEEFGNNYDNNIVNLIFIKVRGLWYQIDSRY